MISCRWAGRGALIWELVPKLHPWESGPDLTVFDIMIISVPPMARRLAPRTLGLDRFANPSAECMRSILTGDGEARDKMTAMGKLRRLRRSVNQSTFAIQSGVQLCYERLMSKFVPCQWDMRKNRMTGEGQREN